MQLHRHLNGWCHSHIDRLGPNDDQHRHIVVPGNRFAALELADNDYDGPDTGAVIEFDAQYPPMREWCCDYCGEWNLYGLSCWCGCTYDSWRPFIPQTRNYIAADLLAMAVADASIEAANSGGIPCEGCGTRFYTASGFDVSELVEDGYGKEYRELPDSGNLFICTSCVEEHDRRMYDQYEAERS